MASKKRSTWGRGSIYRRFVYEKNDDGSTMLNKRGEPIVKYEYWQATYEVPIELLPEGVQRRRLTGNGRTQPAAYAALSANKDAFFQRKAEGEPLYRPPRKRGTKRRTVDDLFTDWIAHKTDEDISTTVLRKYRRMYEQHIQPHIGKEYLDKISSTQLNQLLNSTLPSKKKLDANGKPIPGTTLLGAAARLNIWKTVRMCFRWGELSDYFVGRANPMMLVKQPKVVKRTIDIDAREADADRVMEYLNENRPELLALMGFQLLGLRQMERLGLRLEDVVGLDTKHPKLLVRGQLGRYETEDVEKNGDNRRWYWKDRTKTLTEREIPLTEPFLGYLRDHLKRREANTKRADYKDWGDDPIGSLLFLTDRGAVISKTTDNEIWKEVCLAAGVEPYSQHINRFITAAKLAALKPAVPGNVVRAILGHESTAIGYYYQKITAGNSEEALTRYGKTYKRTSAK
jgi:site-specific recombinase XerC